MCKHMHIEAHKHTCAHMEDTCLESVLTSLLLKLHKAGRYAEKSPRQNAEVATYNITITVLTSKEIAILNIWQDSKM